MTEARPDSLSIFFPAYNDWGTIASMVILAHEVARELTPDFEVIVINDASPDHVDLILDELRSIYPQTFRVVKHEKNRGYGGALKSGFAAASKDFVFYTDGDAQYDVREIRLLWAKRTDVDLVNGWKIKRSDPLHRKVVGRVYHHFVRFCFQLPVRDVDCDFRLIRRSIFERFRLESDSGLICVELMTRISRATTRIAQVPVHHFHRMHGQSQFFNFPRVARVLIGMIGLWWRVFVTEPKQAPVGSERSGNGPGVRG
ncbi:MAG: glycosyltransferase family 2 protein [Candidatus Eisenbacteria bacterium]|nr:glycosyltransferase family 2 protein [Candidatus Eisenbacteria bacterium]MCC7144026.1 glycosyltransferase family 2 protein [Candidatus Eisenbacteria bacterium]